MRRSQARTHLPANKVRNRRALLSYSAATLWRTLSLRCRRSRAGRLRVAPPPLHIRQPCSQLPLPGQGQREGVLAGQATSCTLYEVIPRREGTDKGAFLVPGVICEQGHLIFRRPAGGNQEEKASAQGREAGRADDGLWHSHRVRVRRKDTLRRDGDRGPTGRRKGPHDERAERPRY